MPRETARLCFLQYPKTAYGASGPWGRSKGVKTRPPSPVIHYSRPRRRRKEAAMKKCIDCAVGANGIILASDIAPELMAAQL